MTTEVSSSAEGREREEETHLGRRRSVLSSNVGPGRHGSRREERVVKWWLDGWMGVRKMRARMSFNASFFPFGFIPLSILDHNVDSPSTWLSVASSRRPQPPWLSPSLCTSPPAERPPPSPLPPRFAATLAPTSPPTVSALQPPTPPLPPITSPLAPSLVSSRPKLPRNSTSRSREIEYTFVVPLPPGLSPLLPSSSFFSSLTRLDSLQVTNLPFSLPNDMLGELFWKMTDVPPVSVLQPTRTRTRDKRKVRNVGFGFVEWEDEREGWDAARKAVKMSGKVEVEGVSSRRVGSRLHKLPAAHAPDFVG